MKRISLLSISILFFACATLAQAANPVPFVNNPLMPASVAPGSGAFTLTVNGTAFVSTSVVKWNGSPRSSTFVSSTQLTASITAADVASAGSAAITVNSGGVDSNVTNLWIATSVPKIVFDYPYTGVLMASAPSDVLAYDFNGDGKADVALANGYSVPTGIYPHQVGILFGNGDTSFQTAVIYPTAPQTNAVAMGDFNADGVMDLVASGSTREATPDFLGFSILLGNGDGSFQPALNISTTVDFPGVPLVADFNRDGNLDIAEYLGDTSQIAVFAGNGDGTFQSPVITTMSAKYNFAWIGDFNGDGILDLAGPTAVTLGNGDGTFQPPIFLMPNSEPVSATIGDFNGDGKLDLATSGYIGISVCLGNGDGTFRPGILSHGDPGDLFGQLVAVDLNGDGVLDLLETHTYGNRITYSLGRGDGTFHKALLYNAVTPVRIAVADLDGDGRPDAIYTGGQTQHNDLGIYKLVQKHQ